MNRRQNRLIWYLFRRISGRTPAGLADTILALAGPTMAVLSLAAWMLWMVVAFALIYYPWIDSFLVSPGELRSP